MDGEGGMGIDRRRDVHVPHARRIARERRVANKDRRAPDWRQGMILRLVVWLAVCGMLAAAPAIADALT